ncbi:lipoprotein-releasing system ATP-binding protein [Dyadobacter psychrophilus]|uniref:Lipoprotein-releasing system ATP-binding protein n=2 Tax=Dyadobacter psychrophilus TaxID=651661 RepID=A0A1T5FEQ5_9BACT|nr:lipoprotein-releasing system ATP-binding protein [Dyadobacter psychrophilus]
MVFSRQIKELIKTGVGFSPIIFLHNMNLLRASGIRRTYGSLQVLKGIDLEVERGEVVAIVGPSGAGKSTFLHILGTLDRPEQGQVFIEDINVFTQKDKDLARFRNEKIGFIFQFHNLLAEFTALENACMPGYINGMMSEKEILTRGRELLDMLGLKDRADHLPSQLSGGEQQRVAVARALLNKPSIVLADEPSGNLDSHNALELHQLFFKLRDEFGQTFVIVTHNEDLAAMADRRLVMQDGFMQS